MKSSIAAAARCASSDRGEELIAYTTDHDRWNTIARPPRIASPFSAPARTSQALESHDVARAAALPDRHQRPILIGAVEGHQPRHVGELQDHLTPRTGVALQHGTGPAPHQITSAIGR